jgi:hypothetical protein
MKTIKFLIASVVLPLAVTQTNAQALIPELKCFEKIVNQKWIGRFDDTTETSENILTIEATLDGAAIMETHCIPTAGNFCSRTFYYWDPEAKAIAATRITNNQWLFRFTVTPKDSIFLYEGTRYDPKGKVSKVTSKRVVHSDGRIKDNSGGRDSRTYRKKLIIP